MFVRLFWSSVSYARKAEKLIARTIKSIMLQNLIFSQRCNTDFNEPELLESLTYPTPFLCEPLTGFLASDSRLEAMIEIISRDF